MVEQLKQHLAFELNAEVLWNQDRFLLMQPIIDTFQQKHAEYKNNWLVKKTDSLIAKDKNDPWNDGNKTRFMVLAADALQGWATGPIVDSYEGKMKKAGSKYRTPGEYRDEHAPQGVTGKTEEEIHPTVWYRMQQLGKEYQPEPLKGFDRKQKKTGNTVSYEWVKGNVRIPESKLGGMQSIERSCLMSKTARDFVGRLDKEYGIDSFEAKALDGPLETPGSQQNQGFQPGGSGF